MLSNNSSAVIKSNLISKNINMENYFPPPAGLIPQGLGSGLNTSKAAKRKLDNARNSVEWSSNKFNGNTPVNQASGLFS